jgi:hypothetical protein
MGPFRNDEQHEGFWGGGGGWGVCVSRDNDILMILSLS